LRKSNMNSRRSLSHMLPTQRQVVTEAFSFYFRSNYKLKQNKAGNYLSCRRFTNDLGLKMALKMRVPLSNILFLRLRFPSLRILDLGRCSRKHIYRSMLIKILR